VDKNQEKLLESVEAQMAFIQQSSDLREVNQLLTDVMARQKHSALIDGGNLNLICDAVIDLAQVGDGDDDENRLLAAAVLGRLSAVARSRKDQAFVRISELFEHKPLPIETLADGDEKYYAALSCAEINSDWIEDYCHTQIVHIDTAEKARRVLLGRALHETGSLSRYWQQSMSALSDLKEIENDDSRFKRIRRIANAMLDVTRNWQGEVGSDVGLALADWFEALVKSSKKEAEEEVIADITDIVLGILLRVIELRFSNALLAPTYRVLESARDAFGRTEWSSLTRNSGNLDKVRIALKEAALVLARQNTQDSELMDILCTAYHTRAQAMPAIKSHFAEARDLDPETKAWWEQGGEIKESQRNATQKMGNPEDQQIGTLLINVEESKTVMEKLERAVVPFLEISDPPLAETVKKAAGSYAEISLATKQLSTMRKLGRMDLKNSILEYNPLQHEMVGGHKLGIRKVKVVRDGIQKDFGGKIKVLVKPRVVPSE
jgi:hypothetical protein